MPPARKPVIAHGAGKSVVLLSVVGLTVLLRAFAIAADIAVSTVASSPLAAATLPEPIMLPILGIATAASTPRIATTTRSSIRVNPFCPLAKNFLNTLLLLYFL